MGTSVAPNIFNSSTISITSKKCMQIVYAVKPSFSLFFDFLIDKIKFYNFFKMTIPSWDKFMMPALQNSNEEIRVLDLAEICAKHFNLTAEEMNLGYEKNPGKKLGIKQIQKRSCLKY